MPKTQFQKGTPVTKEWLNAISSPVFDGADEDGHHPPISDDDLSGEAGQVKDRLAIAQSDLVALQGVVNTKADASTAATKTELTALQTTVNSKADASTAATKTELNAKANQSDLTALQTTVNSKADASTAATKTELNALTISADRVTSGTLATARIPDLDRDFYVNGVRVGRGSGADVQNTVVGRGALASNTTGEQNTVTGIDSGKLNTTASFNSYYGAFCGASSTTGSRGSFFGTSCGWSNTTGNHNSFFGVASGYLNTTGEGNNFFGVNSGFSNTTGAYNSFFGVNSGFSNTTGLFNNFFGVDSGRNNTTGSANISFGGTTSSGVHTPVFNLTTENNRVVMGSTAVTNAYIQVAWTVVSDARDKTNFGKVPLGLDFVNALNPVSYQYKVSREDDTPNGRVRYGFKAQEVLALEGANSVIVDSDDPEKLRFNSDSLIAVLVKSIQELTQIVEGLQSEVQGLKSK